MQQELVAVDFGDFDQISEISSTNNPNKIDRNFLFYLQLYGDRDTAISLTCLMWINSTNIHN